MQVTFLTKVYGSPGNFSRGETADLDADWAQYYVACGWAIEGTPDPKKGLPDDPQPVPEGSAPAAPAAPGPPPPPRVEKGKAAKPAPHTAHESKK